MIVFLNNHVVSIWHCHCPKFTRLFVNINHIRNTNRKGYEFLYICCICINKQILKAPETILLVNIDMVNTAIQIICYSLASTYMRLALVNMGKCADACRDPVCGQECVRASQEMRVKLQVTVSSQASQHQQASFILCVLKASYSGSNNQLLMFETTKTKGFPHSAMSCPSFTNIHVSRHTPGALDSLRICLPAWIHGLGRTFQ